MSEGQSTVAYKSVPGFPGYRVGDDGSVWSCWKRIGLGRGTKVVIGDAWRRLRTPTGKRVYPLVVLRRDNKSFTFPVHKLVLLAFVGPRPDGMVTRHFPDHDTRNNALSNLSYGTPLQNSQDCISHGRTYRGTRQHSCKLTEDQVRAIRASYQGGRSQADLAREYGVTFCTITNVVRRRKWKHVA
jgi:hypothetical protein